MLTIIEATTLSQRLYCTYSICRLPTIKPPLDTIVLRVNDGYLVQLVAIKLQEDDVLTE